MFHVKQSFVSQAFWPIPQLTPADISSTTNISPQCFTWNTHPKRIPISSFCNQRPTTRSISPLNHVRETILFHVEHCWDQCYLQRYISRKTYKQARRLNAIFSLKSICYTIFYYLKSSFCVTQILHRVFQLNCEAPPFFSTQSCTESTYDNLNHHHSDPISS